jgi:nicotinate-nucleotide--dimethylbenzimidazole phosphoribosyltransferase
MDPRVEWWRSVCAAPRPENPVLVVVLDDDPDAVSALPPGFSSRWRADTENGLTPTARVAEHLGVPIQFADSKELPQGHDLVLLADAGRGMTTAAAQVACTHLNAEPQSAVGYGSGVSDIDWMRKVTGVRTRAQAAGSPPAVPAAVRLLADLLAGAADSATPVLLDGVVCAGAATVAEQLPPVQVPVLGREPSHRLFLDHLDLAAWAADGIGPGQGLGALGGLAALNVALLAADV